VFRREHRNRKQSRIVPTGLQHLIVAESGFVEQRSTTVDEGKPNAVRFALAPQQLGRHPTRTTHSGPDQRVDVDVTAIDTGHGRTCGGGGGFGSLPRVHRRSPALRVAGPARTIEGWHVPAVESIVTGKQMRRLLAVCLVFLAVAGCSPSAADCNNQQAPAACTRVLFIGNSFTYVNDLPATFARLARSGGHAVETAMAAQGGFRLQDHLASSETMTALRSARWNFVILQEQSQLPAIEQLRSSQTDPAARLLVRAVRAAGASPMFFVTWAHRAGWPENGLPTYESMQRQIDLGYLAIARQLGAPVAPVGPAWLAVNRGRPAVDLWQADGIHPSPAGTYLAACVFYAAIFHESPLGAADAEGLSGDTSRALQSAGADAVLADPGKWGLP
jgi:hypothetical protein